MKKYYPSAVQSAECEEFLVSLTAEESLIAEDPYKSGAKDDADKSVNGNSKPLNYDYEYMGGMAESYHYHFSNSKYFILFYCMKSTQSSSFYFTFKKNSSNRQIIGHE